MDKCQAVSQSNASNLMDTNVMQTCIFLTIMSSKSGEFSIQHIFDNHIQ